MSDKSACGAPDAVNMVLAGSLGLVAVAIAIVAAVTGSSVLAIVIGVIALILAAMTAWLSQMRRNLTSELQGAQTNVARLEAALDEQSKAQSKPETAAPTVQEPIIAPVETDAPRSLTGAERLGAEVMATPPPGDLNDPDTGLLGEQYFHVTLDGRVASARRHLRPLSLILIDAIEGLDENSPHNADPSIVAGIVVETLRDADIVCRLTDGRFALILEDTPENGAIWTVERIRRRINEEFNHVTVWAGVACYPAHGFDGPEVLDQARRAVSAARDWRQDRTEVAES